MGLSKINFIKGQGGLGAPLPGEDHISGIVAFENIVITKKLTFTAALVALNSVHVHITGSGGLDEATDIVFITDTDTTMTAIQTWIAGILNTAAINVAVALDPAGAGLKRFIQYTVKPGKTVTITAVVTLGASQATATQTTVTSIAYTRKSRYLQLADAEAEGIIEGDAKTGYLWYHISEFFRMNPSGILYVWVGDDPAAGAGTNDFTESIALQNYADGKCRQIGYFLPVTFNAAMVSALTAVYDTLFAQYTPAILLLAADTSAVIDHTAFVDLTTYAAPGVGVVIGQDGDGAGAALATALGKAFPALGALLGTFSAAKVSENIGWRGKFDLSSSNGELANPALGDGSFIRDITLATLADIQDKGYIFMLKEVGLTGTFWSDDPACTLASDDYNFLEKTRTIDKAIRGVRTAVLPQLNGPVPVDATSGKLSPDYIAELQAIASAPLQQMERDGELSGFDVIIDPTQNVLTSNKITFTLKQVPVGVARTFDINTKFVTSL
jgi:hypothetical protein